MVRAEVNRAEAIGHHEAASFLATLFKPKYMVEYLDVRIRDMINIKQSLD